MTEQSAKQSLMGTNAYRNTRYETEAEEHEALLKSRENPSGQEGNSETPSNEQQPEHNWEKRYKDLQSYHSKTVNQLKQEASAAKLQDTPRFVPPKTPEEMAAFRADKPEEYAFIQSIAHDIAKGLTQGIQSEFETVSTDLMKTRIEKATLAIQAAHPDWAQLRDSEAFHEWGQAQDEVIQGWLYNNPDNAQNAIRAISLYKMDAGLQGKQNKTANVQPNASQSVDIRGQHGLPTETDRNHPGYIWKDSEISKMRPDEFAKWQPIIQLAYREGRYAQGL